MDNQNFKNCTYFILPYSISDEGKLTAFLREQPDWQENEKPFELNYLQHYVSTIADADDDRMQAFRYRAIDTLPITDFKERMEEKLGKPMEGTLQIEEVNLYVFATRIAFLEFKIDYAGMNIDEIEFFVFLFRSLRNSEDKEYLKVAEGKEALGSLAERLLPTEKTGAVLCFSNPSSVKSEAAIFSLIDTKSAGLLQEEEFDAARYRLANGYHPQMATPQTGRKGADDRYELYYNGLSESAWGGAQDGLVCLTQSPFYFQYNQLCNDYHFMYLLLLHQRFASMNYIEQMVFARAEAKKLSELHSRTVDLKIRYSFRVLSEDRIVQNVYSRMYHLLELDELQKDMDENNEQMLHIKQIESEKNEKRVARILLALSLLAVFSALIDLSDYLDRFGMVPQIATVVSLIVIVIAACLAVVFFRKE